MSHAYASILLHHDLLEQSARMEALLRLSQCFTKKGGTRMTKHVSSNYCFNNCFNESSMLHHHEKPWCKLQPNHRLTHMSCTAGRQQNPPGASAKGRWTKRPRRPADLNKSGSTIDTTQSTYALNLSSTKTWKIILWVFLLSSIAELRKIKYAAVISSYN